MNPFVHLRDVSRRMTSVKSGGSWFVAVTTALLAAAPLGGAETVTLRSLLAETTDPAARTWLPGAASSRPSADAATRAVDDFLQPLQGQMRLLGCWYDGPRLAATRAFVNGRLQTQASQWSCELRHAPVAGEPDALDLTLTFALQDGVAVSAGVAVAFDFAGWSTNHYVLIPAAVYNGNRNRIVARGYNQGLDRRELYNRNLQLTTGDLPHLALEPGQPSKLGVNACNATTPAICFFNRQTRRAFMVLAEQGLRRENGTIIDHGLMVEESADRTRATLVVSAPGVRERKPEFIGFSASPDRGMDWKPGSRATLRLRVYAFETPDIPGLLDRFMTVRKAVTGPNHPRHLVPSSETIRLMTRRIDSRFHDGANKFYCPENAAWISFGWVGGLMNTFPMLVLGDEPRRDRVTKTFDFALGAQGRSGYFHGCIDVRGKPFGREAYDDHPEIVLTRKNGDVLYWMVKQFELLRAQGQAAAIKPGWEQSARRLAQAFVDTWKRCGQWGNHLNVETGEVAIYNTTGGASAVGGLALAAKYFGEPAFLKVAQEAADYYYDRDVVKLGLTSGGCADILQNADSETAPGFMTALMALYETTGDTRWLEKSRHLANLLATWTVSHDYQLPPNTELAQLGAKLAGVVWASTQNKHGAPGSCTSSLEPLFKIYRATGDRRYAELLRDIMHAHAEGVKPSGEITERLTYCDADSRGSRGEGSTGWCELNGILMAMELPGIYLRTDKDELFVFDHVEANVIKRDKTGVTLKIANPTRFDAQVTVFTENGLQAQRPLGRTGFLIWPKLEIKSGQSTQITLQ
jgi:hypothetical protein